MSNRLVIPVEHVFNAFCIANNFFFFILSLSFPLQIQICPICVSLPWADTNQVTRNLVSHLNLRHRFDYGEFVVSFFFFDVWRNNGNFFPKKSKCQIKIFYLTCVLDMLCSCSLWNSEADLSVCYQHEVLLGIGVVNSQTAPSWWVKSLA